MYKKLMIFIFGLFIIPQIFSLQMLEPVMVDLEYNDSVEIGVVAPGEYFLLSFFLDEPNQYDTIATDGFGANYISFENTQTTGESIYTVARINDNASGEKQIKIILKNKTTGNTVEIYLKARIESNVISTFVLPYDKNSKFGETKDIKIKIINKSITTKKITISSNLPATWFESKNKLNKEKVVYLQPAGTTEVTYSFIPKNIGEKEIELYIYTDFDETQVNNFTPNFLKKIIYERNEEKVNIYVLKNLSALYGSNLYNFPTFGLNSIPVYFFNNVVRIITS
ncbi:MAG TPA: hypothetical protein PK685_00275 [archaeon]|nr:hypothetical protein [archaeon]